MKPLLPYLIVFVGSLVSALLATTLIWYAKPELFSPRVEPAPAVALEPDSARAPAPKPKVEPPPARPAPAQEQRQSAPPPTETVATALRDSLRRMTAALEEERMRNQQAESRKDSANSTNVAADSTKTKDQKAFARVLDAMQAENAARILKDLPDEEVKVLLLNIKKRQAAKILGALEPDRAARLMR